MNQNLRFSATVLAMSATLGVARFVRGRDQQTLAVPISSIDREVKGWTGNDDPPPSAYILQSLGATSFLSRTYRRSAVEMNLWIAYYANQQAGETMHSPKYCVPGTGWELIAQEDARIPALTGSVAVNDYLMIRPGERMRMLYWYQSRKRVVASEYTGKLALMWDAIRYGQTSGSIVRITLPEGNAQRAEGLAFAGEIMRQVARCYGE